MILFFARSVHICKSSGKQPERLKSKLTLRYTAAKLHEKGVLLEVDGLPTTQFRNVQFEITPTDHNGVFTICGKFMGVELEKIEIDIQVSWNVNPAFLSLLRQTFNSRFYPVTLHYVVGR